MFRSDICCCFVRARGGGGGCVFFFFLMIRRPPRSTLDRSSAASDVYKRQADTDPGTEVGKVGLALNELLDHVDEALTARHAVSYTHLRAHETVLDLVCRLLLDKKQI